MKRKFQLKEYIETNKKSNRFFKGCKEDQYQMKIYTTIIFGLGLEYESTIFVITAKTRIVSIQEVTALLLFYDSRIEKETVRTTSTDVTLPSVNLSHQYNNSQNNPHQNNSYQNHSDNSISQYTDNQRG